MKPTPQGRGKFAFGVFHVFFARHETLLVSLVIQIDVVMTDVQCSSFPSEE